MARMNYKMYPIDYILELQQKGKREKARCFLEYFNDVQLDNINSISFYGKSWGTVDKAKSKGTVFKWIGEFKREIEMFFNYWMLKNKQHYSSVTNQSEQKVNGETNQSERNNATTTPMNKGILNSEVNYTKDESERKVNQGINTINNNINAESNDSSNKNTSNKKHSYSNTFEIIWNLYNKKSSNKNRSFSIYKKRWIGHDIELIKKAIDKYKHNTNPEYYKDFDGFLNGVIDSYVPKKAWVVDANKTKHIGLFYDFENKFISNTNKPLTIESCDIAAHIENKRFGYIKD